MKYEILHTTSLGPLNSHYLHGQSAEEPVKHAGFFSHHRVLPFASQPIILYNVHWQLTFRFAGFPGSHQTKTLWGGWGKPCCSEQSKTQRSWKLDKLNKILGWGPQVQSILTRYKSRMSKMYINKSRGFSTDSPLTCAACAAKRAQDLAISTTLAPRPTFLLWGCLLCFQTSAWSGEKQEYYIINILQQTYNKTQFKGNQSVLAASLICRLWT